MISVETSTFLSTLTHVDLLYICYKELYSFWLKLFCSLGDGVHVRDILAVNFMLSLD